MSLKWSYVARPGLWALCLAVGIAGTGATARAFDFGKAADAHGYIETFGIPRDQKPSYKLTLIESNAPGNVFHPGQEPSFTFQLENLTDQPIRTEGHVDLIRYGGRGRPGEMWVPEFHRIAGVRRLPIQVGVGPKGWQNITIEPKTPETKGGYALVVDLAGHGRQLLTVSVRTFEPADKRVQYPKQSLENMPPEILRRLGIQAIRYGVHYEPSDSRQYREFMSRLDGEFKTMHENRVTAVVEIGAGPAEKPLGRGRPHLTDDGVMKGGKEDLVWLPSYDDDYQAFVYRLACEYGWPEGPITGFMLWNEPWEGLSISGWGADMPRYRELYKRMGEAIHQARKDAGVEVLIGGCDSSTNTWDKLFPDDSDEFLPHLDFCSIHYQGLGSPALYPQWHNRKHYKGRVLIWDTESWVANTDDRFAGVVATNRAAGYDRSMGIRGENVTTVLSHHRIAYDTIQTPDGPQKIRRWIVSWPAAASVGAAQHFIGERDFREILFMNGLPWVYVFHGLDGDKEDGTVVVVGDIASLFAKGGALYGTVRSLDEIKARQAIRQRLAALPTEASEERARLAKQLREPMPFTGATMTLAAGEDRFGLFDFYGNPIPAENGKIVIPLDSRGFYLRATSRQSGAFDALLQALREARIEGIEPLEMIPHDFTARVETSPTLRIRLTNMLSHPIAGKLSVQLGGLKVQGPGELTFAARESRTVEMRVSGTPSPDNTYPLSLMFDAGPAGVAVHEESLHVNLISRRTIAVDGRLDDWKGALPQTIRSEEASGRSFTEAMWLPFEKFDAAQAGGLATGYLAYDQEGFYFAAKIADDTPFPGTIRFKTRDHDADFYPEVCRGPSQGHRARDGEAQLAEYRWPEGVRRFSYRRWPAIPSGYSSHPLDNVLIAFNAIPMEQDEWVTHLPGRMPAFIGYKCTDYEFALNKVADEYGGGTEIWRLQTPGMPRKHFWPRQPAHPHEGPVKTGRLAIVHEGNTRVVEASLPWSEIPHVKGCLDAGRTVKFSFRINDSTRGPTMELAMNRSVSKINSQAFHPDWAEHWANELEFAFEK
jgi:hypothetical protein